MKELEKNVMCVLLQALCDKELITQDIQEKARKKILGTLDETEFFCYCEEEGEEVPDGHTKDPG